MPPRPSALASARRALLALVPAALVGLGTANAIGVAQESARPAAASAPAFRQANRVAVLPVSGEIDQITLRSLERRLERVRQEGFGAVVLQIDTPGGDARVTLDICHLLKNDFPANTIAWVDPMAFSAGTFMSLACREIVMSPHAKMGDAAPINLLGPIPPTERAKIEAPFLSEVVDSARRNHYDEQLSRAFVTLTPGLWLLENVRTKARVVVDPTEYRAVMGTEPPTTGTTPAGGAQGAAQDFRPMIMEIIKPDRRRSGTELTKEELAAEVEFEQQLPPTRAPLTEADRGEWTVVMQVVMPDTLLTLTTEEARFFGFSQATIASDDELKSFLGASELVRIDESWSEAMVRFLVSLPVRVILIAVFLVALFLDLASPGVGVFGATAAVALLMLIGAPALAGMAQWWEILLILVGLALLGAEFFVIPGFGIAGVLGALCLLVGLVGTFVSSDLTSPASRDSLWTGLAATMGAFFAAGVAIWLISRQIESMPLFRKFILNAELGRPLSAPAAAPGLLSSMGASQRALQPGDIGTAATDLRPTGRGEFGGRIVDVQSAVGYIERGTPIRVLSVDRLSIEVEEAR
ncbi:MAG: hypothetical protein KDA22_03350 [Phycisphaerales bacterium]|nr:hypothetical protein [Phycisphaerales bacterium]